MMTVNKQEKHLGSHPNDIEEILTVIEKSYDITFEQNELHHVRTFGEFTDHIISKISLDNKYDCTDQQAFYKLRTVIIGVKKNNRSSIEPKSLLTDIFPRKTRRKEIREIEEALGLNLDALQPRPIIANSLLLALLISTIGLFIHWQFGLTGIVLSVGGLWLAVATGKEFTKKTLGELADRMTQLNYVKSRRQSGTVNLNEVHTKIEKLFIENLGLEEKTIGRDTVIV